MLTGISCPPQTGRELAPGDQAFLIRLSWLLRARYPQPLCMRYGFRQARMPDLLNLGDRLRDVKENVGRWWSLRARFVSGHAFRHAAPA